MAGAAGGAGGGSRVEGGWVAGAQRITLGASRSERVPTSAPTSHSDAGSKGGRVSLPPSRADHPQRPVEAEGGF